MAPRTRAHDWPGRITVGAFTSLRPTEQGAALAKDAWMLGMGIGFTLDEFLSRRDR